MTLLCYCTNGVHRGLGGRGSTQFGENQVGEGAVIAKTYGKVMAKSKNFTGGNLREEERGTDKLG